MPKRTPSDIYADLLARGFTPAQAVTMTAIAGAESGYDDANLGDVGLEDNTWGPSYGLYQIRTLKAQTNTGGDRDINWLAASDANQAKAAYDISQHGRDFSPWSTFTGGGYGRFLGQANAAGTATSPVWNPLGGLSDTVLGGVRGIVVEAVFVGLGLALVGVGIARAVAPQYAKLRRAAHRKGEQAAKVLL